MIIKFFFENYKKIIYLLIFLSITFFLYYSTQWIKKPENLFSAKWNLSMTLFGGKKSFNYFKQTVSNNSPLIQHSLAHQFGTLLYKKYGEAGIDFCDDSYGYGCYHSLVGQAIIEKGTPQVYDLANRCSVLPNLISIKSCQHGIGHGLIGYFGYNTFGIYQAVAVCNTLQNILTANDCGSGIFMEYNFQDMAENPGNWRVFQKENPFNPCDITEKEFQPICYFQQAAWWLKVLPQNDISKIDQINKFCTDLKEQNQRECFKGLSYYLGSYFEWDSQKVKHSCLQITNQEEQKNCLSQAAQIFANGHQLKQEGRYLCEEITATDSATLCLKQIGL
jgi:hypothetical protein